MSAGHEFSPLIYNYDERKGAIEFVEKLDQQDGTSGKQTIGLDIQFFGFILFIFLLYREENEFFTPYQAAYEG